jgi:tRNA threonylcarbamoyladenosine biosynthesis protein TsaE
MTYTVKTEEDLSSITLSILQTCQKERIFALYGEMGIGKTTLIKQFCHHLRVTDVTTSPTFAIVNEYHTTEQIPVYHFDFYRIETVEEAIRIGLEEYLDSGCYCFIEWAEKIAPFLQDNCVKITMEKDAQNNRIIHID